MSRRLTLPWESLRSLRAGLPRTRAAWLALVLPLLDRADSHTGAAALLRDEGHDLGERPEVVVRAWHRRLDRMRAAGDLPEHPAPLPVRTPGRLPSADACRLGAATVNARRKPSPRRSGRRASGKSTR